MNINEMSDKVLTFTELVAAEQADLRQRIAELERHNKLLRAALEASVENTDKILDYLVAHNLPAAMKVSDLIKTAGLQAAIDGGALETAYTEGFEAGKKANGG